MRDGVFAFGAGTVVRYPSYELQPLAGYLYRETGRRATVEGVAGFHGAHNVVLLAVDPARGLPDEGYTLEVEPDTVRITGADRAGLFYGIQTLRQLIPPGDNILVPVAEIPCLRITDYPRFPYRGFTLDVARTFSPFEEVIRLLDLMAFHKMNRFHWHLTDDEGWRLPLECYPELAREGGFRGAGSPVRNIYGAWGERYGGYYTTEQVRAVIDHAAFRNIEVVPEFDLPGHSRAVARLHPEILCRGPVDTASSAGYDLRKVWCAGREENFEMIERIIDEICVVFPGAIIHTGGDEVPPEQWETCPDCRALMKREGLEDTAALNTWFENRVGRMVADRGRRQAVWNEAADGGTLEYDPVIWAWENHESVVKALRAGYDVVNMTSQYYYFDMKQSASEVGLAWGGIVDLAKTYGYDPVPEVRGGGRVIGVNGGFWTETFLWNGEWWRDYQLFPRLCALAETAWSPESARSPEGFRERLDGWHLARLDALGVAYRGAPGVGIREAYTVPEGRMRVAYDVTGSVPCTARNPYSHAADNDTRTVARTVRTARPGDWFEFRFRSPVRCGSITVRSGYSALPRFVIGPAVLEVSYDGSTYEVADPRFGYTGTFRPRAAVHSLRLTVTGEGNGEDAVIIQDLIIMP